MGRWWVRDRTHSTCAFAHTTQSANGQLLPRNNQVSISPISRACFSLLSSGARSALDLECSDSPVFPLSWSPRPDLPLGFSAGDTKILRKRMNLESPQRLVGRSK